MRLALLADIHGNLAALKAVLAAVDAVGVDAILSAGDHLVSGPRPNAVFRLLQSRGAIMVRGNNDQDILDMQHGGGPPHWQEGLHFAPLRWTVNRLERDVLDGIAALPEQRVVALDGAAPIRMVHGSPRDIREPLVPVQGEPLDEISRVVGWPNSHVPPSIALCIAHIDEPVLVCGHTHLQFQTQVNGTLVVNPGSAGIPVNDNGTADYALLDNASGHWQAELRAAPYDHDQVLQDYVASGLATEGGPVGRVFLADTVSGQVLCIMFFRHTRRVAARRGFTGPHYPDEIWLEAEETFDRAAAAKRYLPIHRRFMAAVRQAAPRDDAQ